MKVYLLRDVTRGVLRNVLHPFGVLHLTLPNTRCGLLSIIYCPKFLLYRKYTLDTSSVDPPLLEVDVLCLSSLSILDGVLYG